MFKNFQKNSSIAQLKKSSPSLYNGVPSNAITNAPSVIVNDGTMLAWWEGSYGITLNGTTVSAWVDKISGYSFTQATASLQPAFIAYDPLFNGYPSLNFTGTNTLSAGNVLNIGTLAGMTMIIAGRTNNNTSAGQAFLSKDTGGNPSTNGEYQIHVYPGTSVANSYYDSGGLRFPAQVSIPLSCNLISANVIDRTAGLLWGYNYIPYQYLGNATYNLNGTVSALSTTITTGTTNYTPTAVLNINKGNTGLTLLEVIFYNRALSATEMTQLILTLKNKYKFT